MRVWPALILALLYTACAATSPDLPVTAPGCAALAEPTAVNVETARGNAVAPKFVRRVDPRAPSSLFGRSAEATVEAIIGEDGQVRNVCIASGNQVWGNAIATALRRSTFTPGTLDGRPVAVQLSLTAKWSS
jgi:hypothetical protein